MGIIGGIIGYKLLRRINPGGAENRCDGSAYSCNSKIEVLFGPNIWEEFVGKVMIDLGCGSGREAIEKAFRGAKRVIGIDIREEILLEAQQAAEQAGASRICHFTTETEDRAADVVLSLDSFEHFDAPAAILKRCVS